MCFGQWTEVALSPPTRAVARNLLQVESHGALAWSGAMDVAALGLAAATLFLAVVIGFFLLGKGTRAELE